MGTFSDPLRLDFIDQEGRYATLVLPLTYAVNSAEDYTVPAGYRTDGATVPRFFWRICPPWTGNYRKAVVLHDWLCDTKEIPYQRVHEIFAESMEALEVPIFQRTLMAIAVRRWGPKW